MSPPGYLVLEHRYGDNGILLNRSIDTPYIVVLRIKISDVNFSIPSVDAKLHTIGSRLKGSRDVSSPPMEGGTWHWAIYLGGGSWIEDPEPSILNDNRFHHVKLIVYNNGTVDIYEDDHFKHRFVEAIGDPRSPGGVQIKRYLVSS